MSCILSAQHVQLFVTAWTIAHQARILEWVVISSSRESSQSPGIESVPPALTGATGNPLVSRITVGRPEL